MAVELINEARKEKYQSFYTENWIYPTEYTFGSPKDKYYAEIWSDGMDWTTNYWLLEAACWDRPKAYGLMTFGNEEAENKLNPWVLRELLEDTMEYRRSVTWFKEDYGEEYDKHYFDKIWIYIRRLEPREALERNDFIVKHRILHGSQPRFEFYMNENLIPPQQSVSNRHEADGIKVECQYPLELDEEKSKNETNVPT
jgi:hypothetical protein